MKTPRILATLVLFFAVGCTQQQTPIATEPSQAISPKAPEAMVDDTMLEDEVIMEESKDTMMYGGSVLSEGNSQVLDFNQADYEKALKSNKLVVLYFYANWCPICKEEIPKFYDAMEELDSSKVIGFRVNFNDNETDDNETALAREFGVAYQHTKVFLLDGERVLKAPDSWNKDRYIKEVNKYLNQ